MEENTALANLIEILKLLGIIITASAPGIYGLLKQHSKDKIEKSKRDSEVDRVKIDTAAKVQEIYQEMLEDIKKQQKENMEQIKELNTSVDKLQQENLMLERNNRELKKLIDDQNEKLDVQTEEILVLKDKVGKLIDQLKRLGVEPEISVTRPINK